MPQILLNKNTSILDLKDFLLKNKDAELHSKNTEKGVCIYTKKNGIGVKEFAFKETMDARRLRARRALITFVQSKNPSVVVEEFKHFLVPDEKTLTQPLHGSQALLALAESQYTPLINKTKYRQKIENEKDLYSLKDDLKAVNWRLIAAKPSTFLTEICIWMCDQAKAPILPAPSFEKDPGKFNLALNFAKHSTITDTVISNDAAQYQTLQNATREFIDQDLAKNAEKKDLHDLFVRSDVVSSAALREVLGSPNSMIRSTEVAARDFIKSIEEKPETSKFLARDLRTSSAKQIERIKFGARLFTDESYLLLYPEFKRPILRSMGLSMGEMAKELENPQGAFQALLRIAKAAEDTPSAFLEDLSGLKERSVPAYRKKWLEVHKIFKKEIADKQEKREK
ncbi:hypothetical protein [Variovorax sp. RA8]|uniref:hypothetical protein n=1 Tax=Variovorax sp. (strain JCM 16519 / RA8) TaxID=662548 RepID=UPI000A5FF72D|nr:hypothetical protein [Variovorax sp. RA8]VTU25894.1 hypothetical protein RA8CHR_03227 [Variovorax sp. RA8]